MSLKLLTFSILFMTGASLSAAELLLKPFALTYAVLDNGKEIGEAKVELKKLKNPKINPTLGYALPVAVVSEEF